MKFAVGYQLADEDEKSFADVVGRYREHIEELYFPWLDIPTGRSPLTTPAESRDGDVQRRLERELREIKEMGIKLNLLLNANCYGRDSLSRHFRDRIHSVISHLLDTVGLDAITTSSLMIARTARESFPSLDIRGSVNMRIGTVKGMEYMADILSSLYIQREYNRDFERIAEMKEWADCHGKHLHILVNSGCLNFCSGQVFHDNLVAHEAEIGTMDNMEGWNPSICWNYYRKREHWVSVLQNSWIRPEDLHHYESYFPMAKLATRMHSHPAKVIRAYCTGRFDGNLIDLFEPGHAPVFSGYLFDNTKFPKDWFTRTTRCDKKCYRCDYCSQVLEKILVRIEEGATDADL
jgi:collagenase-like PrtC family protease